IAASPSVPQNRPCSGAGISRDYFVGERERRYCRELHPIQGPCRLVGPCQASKCGDWPWMTSSTSPAATLARLRAALITTVPRSCDGWLLEAALSRCIGATVLPCASRASQTGSRPAFLFSSGSPCANVERTPG